MLPVVGSGLQIEMTNRPTPYDEPREEPAKRPVAPQRPAAEEEWFEDGPKRDWNAEESAPREKKRGKALWIVLAVLIILVAVAGGIFLASHFKLISLPSFGLSAGGSSSVSTAEPIRVFPASDLKFVSTDGNTVQEDGSLTWLRSKRRSASPEDRSQGSYIELPADLLSRIEGRRIRVTVDARSGATGEPPPFAVTYSTVGRGNSGWFVFVPTARFDEYDFAYQVPIGEVGSEENTHVIGIWADINGTNAPLAIENITIEPL